jgi:hypothetical protein
LSTVCLSMYSITENIYCSQLSSLRYFCSLNPTVSHRIIQGKDCVLSLCAILVRSPLPPTCLVLTVSEARSYFASTINCLTTGRATGRSGFDPQQRQRVFHLASVSRPALGPTQPPVQWVQWILSPGVKRDRGMTLPLTSIW